VGNAAAKGLIEPVPGATHEWGEAAPLGGVNRERMELRFGRFGFHFAI
jgi:hypothetical protein